MKANAVFFRKKGVFMNSRFVDFSGVVSLGGKPEDVLSGDQAEVIQNKDDFNGLVRQAEGMYRDGHRRLPDRDDPNHFKNWPHKELFDLVFACAKEGLSAQPSRWPEPE